MFHIFFSHSSVDGYFTTIKKIKNKRNIDVFSYISGGEKYKLSLSGLKIKVMAELVFFGDTWGESIDLLTFPASRDFPHPFPPGYIPQLLLPSSPLFL